MLKQIILLFIILAITACSHYPKNVEQALTLAGDNCAELERVLEHYRTQPGDNLKYRAACFLIGNMYKKHSLEGQTVDNYYRYIDSIFSIELPEYDIEMYYEAYNKKYQNSYSDLHSRYDLETITSSYLINNIEQAFAVWSKPWNSHLSFDEFCEYILPHRVGNELLEDWRPLYQQRFGTVLQDDTIRTAVDACITINNVLIGYPIHTSLSSISPSTIRASTLINMKFGLCEDWADLAVFSMRANGIPVATDFIPHWGKGNNKHTFNVVYNNDGAYYDFSGAENNPNEHLSRFDGIPKVYRQTYGYQKMSLAHIGGRHEKIPSQLNSPFMLDVTSQYSFVKQQDIELNLQPKIPNRFVYLCVFDPNGWCPVDWAKIETNKALFKNVGVDIIYQAAYYDRNIIPCSAPFLLDSTGNISFLVPSGQKTDLVLDRKYTPHKSLVNIPPSMIGGKFQAADNPQFNHAVDLHTLEEAPSFKYTLVDTKLNRPYRYYRYLAPDESRLNMAEIEFYDDSGNQVKGAVIGMKAPSIYFPRITGDMVFDGDALTFFHSFDPGSWVGMEFDKPVRIEKIRYLIRNDDNGIRKGNDYELFYADATGWKSAGRKIAITDDEIIFKNIPANALYWLRNYTRGKEERIFTYENGKQVWW